MFSQHYNKEFQNRELRSNNFLIVYIVIFIKLKNLSQRVRT